jgi:hypothetical protein
MDLSPVLSKLLALRTELSKAAPQTDKMSLELGCAIQELESLQTRSYPDDGPLLRGQGPTSRMVGDRRPYPNGPDYPTI